MPAQNPQRQVPGRKAESLRGRGTAWATVTWIGLTVLALMPVALLGVYAYGVTAESLRQIIRQSSVSTAVISADLMSHDLDQNLHLCEAFSSLPSMVEAVKRRDVEAARARLRSAADAYPALDRAFLVDLEGHEWCDYPSAPDVIGTDFSSRDYFKGVMRNWKPYVSEVFLRKAEPRHMVVAVAAPVHDGPTRLGVLVFQFRLEVLADWVHRAMIGQTGHVIILDPAGTVAAHPRVQLQARVYNEYAGLKPVRDALAGGTTTAEYQDPLTGQEMMATFMPMEITGRRWVTVAQQPADEAYGPLRRLRPQIITSVEVLALAGLGAVLVLGRAGGRVRRLSRELAAQNRQLDVERNQLRSLIDNIPDRICIKDLEGRYTLDNLAHQQFVRQPSVDSVIGKTVFDFFPHDVATAYTADDRAVLTSGKTLASREEPSPDQSGRMQWVITAKVPLRDPSGEIIGLVCISRDITDRKLAEQQLEEKNHQLEAAIRSERQALENLRRAQEQMVEAEKMAALGQLIAGVAHEINNPLAFVSNNVAVLHRDVIELRELVLLYRSAEATLAQHEPEIARKASELAERIDLPYTLENLTELLNRSRDGLRRIQQIVTDLRDFGRHEAVGHLQEGADVNAGVNSTLNIVRGRARKVGVELETDLGTLPGIVCQPARINQVLLNLVVNAIDACAGSGATDGDPAPPGRGKVLVRTRPTEGGVSIEVSDNGSGIPPDIRRKIFDPFFTTKPQGQGTGLGLSISHGIIADHGGRIDVDSEPGRGTTFTIFLPMAPPRVHPKPVPVVAEEP